MKVTCPSCGAEMSLDVLLAHQDSAQAFARLVAVGLPLGKLVLQYLRLFNPATRRMAHSRLAALVEELLPDMQRGAITRNGREWAAPRPVWEQALARMLETRDAGKLTLPLKSHGYLYEVIAGLADKVEAGAERDTDAQRRSRVHEAGPTAMADVLDKVQSASPEGPSPKTREALAKARQALAERALRPTNKPGDGQSEGGEPS